MRSHGTVKRPHMRVKVLVAGGTHGLEWAVTAVPANHENKAIRWSQLGRTPPDTCCTLIYGKVYNSELIQTQNGTILWKDVYTFVFTQQGNSLWPVDTSCGVHDVHCTGSSL